VVNAFRATWNPTGYDVESATCSQLMTCYNCLMSHSSSQIETGTCNAECDLAGHLGNPEWWDQIRGGTYFLIGVLVGSSLLVLVPLVVFWCDVRKLGHLQRMQRVYSLADKETAWHHGVCACVCVQYCVCDQCVHV
jgi:hypothetical protein